MNLSQRHVYLTVQEILKEGKDKKFIAHAEQMRKEGFGWRYDGLGDLSTDAIFAKLVELGVSTDANCFREQAQAAGQCKNLEERWRENIEWDDSPWDDFPFLAAEELWRRLTPDLTCPEFIADRLISLMNTVHESRRSVADMKREDREAVAEAIAYLERFPAVERSDRFGGVARLCAVRSQRLVARFCARSRTRASG